MKNCAIWAGALPMRRAFRPVVLGIGACAVRTRCNVVGGRYSGRRRAPTVDLAAARRAAFLVELAASCNVVRAHEASRGWRRPASIGCASGIPNLPRNGRRRWKSDMKGWRRRWCAAHSRPSTIGTGRGQGAGGQDDGRRGDRIAAPASRAPRGEARGRRAPAHQVPTQQEVDAILIKRIPHGEAPEGRSRGRRSADVERHRVTARRTKGRPPTKSWTRSG